MADGYREGYEKGKSDALEGKERDLRPPLGKAVVQGADYTKTYIEGAKAGYHHGKQNQK